MFCDLCSCTFSSLDVEAWACWCTNGSHGLDAGRICWRLHSASDWCVCYAPVWNSTYYSLKINKSIWFFYWIVWYILVIHHFFLLILYSNTQFYKYKSGAWYNFVIDRVWVLKQWTLCSRPRCWTCLNRPAGKILTLLKSSYIFFRALKKYCISMFNNLFTYCVTCSVHLEDHSLLSSILVYH